MESRRLWKGREGGFDLVQLRVQEKETAMVTSLVLAKGVEMEMVMVVVMTEMEIEKVEVAVPEQVYFRLVAVSGGI